MTGVEVKPHYVGNEANAKRGVLNLKYPVEHGIVTDWDGMERIWDYTFSQQLRVTPSDHPILLTECPLNPRSDREKMMEIMFGNFQTPAVYLQMTAVAALYAAGRTTGLVLDSGDAVTYSVPIYEGFAFRKPVQRANIGGRDITQVLQKELNAEGFAFSSSAELDLVRGIKERLCYVAEDFAAECDKPLQEISEDYTLPDGKVINIGQARFKAAETMFDPKAFLEMEDKCGGVCELLVTSIKTGDVDLAAELTRNIILVRTVPLK